MLYIKIYYLLINNFIYIKLKIYTLIKKKLYKNNFQTRLLVV